MRLRLLAVERERNVPAELGQRDGGRRCQRDSLVSRAEKHVEPDLAGLFGFEQGLTIESRQLAEQPAAVK